jgi:hypothetical protein
MASIPFLAVEIYKSSFDVIKNIQQFDIIAAAEQP